MLYAQQILQWPFSKYPKYQNIFRLRYWNLFKPYIYFTFKCRIILYDAFIFSRLNCGVKLYVNSKPKSHMDKLLKVTQNKILKILQFKLKSHTNDLYKDFNVLKIEDKFHVCCLTHKLIHNPHNLPQAITELFTLNKQVYHYNTGNNEGLHAGKINITAYGLRKINHQARLCWESMPNSIKDEISIKAHIISFCKFNHENSENLDSAKGG